MENSPQTPDILVVLSTDDETPIKREPVDEVKPEVKPDVKVPKNVPTEALAIQVLNADDAFDNLNCSMKVIFDQKFFAIATANDTVLSRVKQAVLTRNALPLKLKHGYYYRTFKHLHMKHGCLFYDNKLVVPYCFHQSILLRLHEDHSGSHAMVDRANNLWWPHMRQAIRLIAQNCNDCAYFGKNLSEIQFSRVKDY